MATFRKQASSLLIILLISSAATVIILTGAKALIDAARLSGAKASAQSASSMAQTGIQDGLLLKRSGALAMEYGDGGYVDGISGYSLKRMRRGYSIGTNGGKCTSLGADMAINNDATYDKDCPYYDYEVRRLVKASRVTLSSRSFPDNRMVTLIAPGNPGVNIGFAGGLSIVANSITYRMCVDVECKTFDGAATSPTITDQLQIQLQAADKAIQMTIDFKDAINVPHLDEFMEVTTIGGTGSFLFDKGYTTVDATGYAGGVQKSLLLNIYPGLNWLAINHAQPGFNKDLDSLSLIDFAKHFDETTGIITPQ